ncbi:hypothetical protein BH11PLA1_BH11PLA1_06410 [soil metagenome]
MRWGPKGVEAESHEKKTFAMMGWVLLGVGLACSVAIYADISGRTGLPPPSGATGSGGGAAAPVSMPEPQGAGLRTTWPLYMTGIGITCLLLSVRTRTEKQGYREY